MKPFNAVAIPTDVAESVRRNGKDPRFGHPAYTNTATESAPCRHCLRLIRPGEKQILFTYDAFEGTEKLPLPGPVYIHAEPCERYSEEGAFPPELRQSPRTLNAYAKGRRLLAAEYVDDASIDSALAYLGAQPDVAYIHVRSTAAGCFTFRMDVRHLSSGR
jgi:hypothetical protein